MRNILPLPARFLKKTGSIRSSPILLHYFQQLKGQYRHTMVVHFQIEGKKVMGLNGGPMFKINPSISLFVTCQTSEEIEVFITSSSKGEVQCCRLANIRGVKNTDGWLTNSA